MLEYLEAQYPDVSLLPKGPDKIDDALIAKQVEVVADTKIIWSTMGSVLSEL